MAKQMLKLPIPELSNTYCKYLKVLRPLLNCYEFLKYQDQFKNSVKDGGKLQDLLKIKNLNTLNWLSKWWINQAYLKGNSNLMIFSNPGIKFPHFNYAYGNIFFFLSALIKALQKYHSLINSASQSENIKKLDNLCMAQYGYLFCNSRIPDSGKDKIYRSILSDQAIKNQNEITIIINCNIWKVNVPDNSYFITNCLPGILESIYYKSYNNPRDNYAVSYLTAAKRDLWRQSYYRLSSISEMNKELFDTIHRSSFVLCLDPPLNNKMECQEPQLLQTVSNNILHGLGTCYNTGNRWFDKTLQIIVTEDYHVGINYEHTVAEGGPYIDLMNFVVNELRESQQEGFNGSSVVDNKFDHYSEQFKLLNFLKDSTVEDDVERAKEDADKLISGFDLRLYRFLEFGKSAIKLLKASPDAFVQIALQLAYYKIHGQVCSTYESASTRKFLHGRTETIRSCTIESKAFSEAFIQQNHKKASTQSDKNKQLISHNQDLKNYLVVALAKHQELTKEAINGQGIDRHLLGLRMIAEENGLDVPEIFKDPAYAKSMYFSLSTSQISSPLDSWMFYGPSEINDGRSYAFCYNTQKTSVNYAISLLDCNVSKDVKASRNDKLSQAFQESMLDIHAILTQ